MKEPKRKQSIQYWWLSILLCRFIEHKSNKRGDWTKLETDEDKKNTALTRVRNENIKSCYSDVQKCLNNGPTIGCKVKDRVMKTRSVLLMVKAAH